MITRPTDSPTPDDLFAIAGGGWGYAEAEWIGGWHARASGGFTHRANSAWPIAVPAGSGGRGAADVSRTLDAIRDWYAARGLPALVQCIVGSELDQALAARGHDRVEQAATRQCARVDTVLAALAHRGAPADVGVCVLADRPDPGWLGVYRAGELPPVAGRVLGAGSPDIRFAAIADARDGSTLAIGRVALAAAPGGGPDTPQAPAGPAGWAGLAAIEVVPAARRRGLAQMILRELIEWAAGRGATDLFLEVRADNAAAVELYRTLGFSAHHAYHYRVIESRLG